MNQIVLGDNLDVLRRLPDGLADLVYVDPPFNTGRTQSRTRIKTTRSENGDRTGFQGRRYETSTLGTKRFHDKFDDYLAFLEPRLREAYRILAPHGSFYLHVDYREVHRCEKAARGKLPTDTWWHTIVPTNGAERTGYPTQKPLGILRRIVTASSRPGDVVLDFFAGSGTTGMAAHELGRSFILVDNNPEALEVMASRFVDVPDTNWEGFDPTGIQGKDDQGSLFATNTDSRDRS
ncbi:MAG: DNA methyltransferase [Gemmatimonadota bacterium]|nr:DNA methyltransferase [Gemmatimonadota bacterium]